MYQRQDKLLTKPGLSLILFVSFSLWKLTTFCIHCSPVAGLSGWMYILLGISGSAFPATIHLLWRRMRIFLISWQKVTKWQMVVGLLSLPARAAEKMFEIKISQFLCEDGLAWPPRRGEERQYWKSIIDREGGTRRVRVRSDFSTSETVLIVFLVSWYSSSLEYFYEIGGLDGKGEVTGTSRLFYDWHPTFKV